MKAAALPAVAPRGKAFKVIRMDHVVGGRVLPVLMPGRWTDRNGADNAASRVDRRLQPTVVLIDIRAVEEATS